jgi:two-component system, OmpR family, phosphate regulon sensor histidine kinase PhoR
MESDQESRRQLEMLRAVVDGMSEGLWITDPDGRVIQHNNALKEMLYAGTELVGRTPLQLLRSQELAQAVARACRDGVTTRLEVTVEGVRPRVLSVQVSPLGRDLLGSAGVFQDVTELQRLEKVRKDFVANVSHELRTPITAIRGYAETLKAGALNDASNAPKMVDIIHRQSERLSELVEDLLELSRIDAKQIQLQKVPVNLEKAAQRTAETIKPKAEAKSIAVEIAVPPGLQAEGDQRAIEQVLVNLLDNAVKYTGPGGRVVVTGKQRGADVDIVVKDTGAGIDARHLPRIFERFYRVDKGRSRELGGTGLGLSIVKNLVNLMQGEVWVESRPGEGSTFFVELPGAPKAP